MIKGVHEQGLLKAHSWKLKSYSVTRSNFH